MAQKYVRFSGGRRLGLKLDILAKLYPQALQAALYLKSQEVLGHAVELTPKDTGDLRRSAYAAPPIKIGGIIRGQIGFGQRYALPVHERVEVFHEVGGPLFLREAIMRARSDWSRDLAVLTRKFARTKTRLGGISRKYKTIGKHRDRKRRRKSRKRRRARKT